MLTLPQPSATGLATSNVPTISRFQTVATQVTITPSAGTIAATIIQGKTCLCIYTGATPINEEYFYLYVKIGSSATMKIRAERFDRYFVAVSAGQTVAIGTTDGRNVTLQQGIGPTSATGPAGPTQIANADQCEPRVWSPSNAHVWLRNPGSTITIVATSTWRNVFISEYDGVKWSPPCWHPLNTLTGNRVFVCMGSRLSIATQDGSPVSIIGTPGTVVGGVSTVYQLPFPSVTGTIRSISSGDATGFNNAIAASVSGDRISVSDGTITLSSPITAASFIANGGASTGGQGIQICAATPGSTNCKIICGLIGAGGSTGWNVVPTSDTIPLYYRDLTWLASSLSAGPSYGGKVRVESNHWIGDTTGVSIDNASYTGSASRATDAIFSNCTSTLSSGDNFAANTGGFSGDLGVLAINPKHSSPGTNANDQCWTQHFGMQSQIIGGTFTDAQFNLIANQDTSETTYCEFSAFSKGSAGRQSNLTNVASFGAISTSWNGGLSNVNPFTTHMIIDDIAGTMATGAFMRNFTTPFDHCFIRVPVSSSSRLVYNAQSGNFVCTLNFVWFHGCIAASEGCITHAFSSGTPLGSTNLNNVSFTNCTTGVYDGDTLLALTLKNILSNPAASGNSVTSVTSGSMAKITTSYGTYGSNNSSAFTAGTSDNKNITPQIDSLFQPSSSGNCDLNGDGTVYDWIGGRDCRGLRIAYSFLGSNPVISRGAISRPIFNGQLLPDSWAQ